MINSLSVMTGIACLTWAAWQVNPIYGWATLGVSLMANGIGGVRKQSIGTDK